MLVLCGMACARELRRRQTAAVTHDPIMTIFSLPAAAAKPRLECFRASDSDDIVIFVRLRFGPTQIETSRLHAPHLLRHIVPVAVCTVRGTTPSEVFRAYSYYNRTGGSDDDERPINGHTAVSELPVYIQSSGSTDIYVFAAGGRRHAPFGLRHAVPGGQGVGAIDSSTDARAALSRLQGGEDVSLYSCTVLDCCSSTVQKERRARALVCCCSLARSTADLSGRVGGAVRLGRSAGSCSRRADCRQIGEDWSRKCAQTLLRS